MGHFTLVGSTIANLAAADKESKFTLSHLEVLIVCFGCGSKVEMNLTSYKSTIFPALETVDILAHPSASIAKVEVACGEIINLDANISRCTSDIRTLD